MLAEIECSYACAEVRNYRTRIEPGGSIDAELVLNLNSLARFWDSSPTRQRGSTWRNHKKSGPVPRWRVGLLSLRTPRITQSHLGSEPAFRGDLGLELTGSDQEGDRVFQLTCVLLVLGENPEAHEPVPEPAPQPEPMRND